MSTEVTLNLQDGVYRRAQEFAALHQQDIATALTTVIEEKFSGNDLEEGDLDWTTPDAAVARERAAYFALHPHLVKSHLGKYVAIYDGKLIDSDESAEALYRRVNSAHPQEFVWITQVRTEPMPTLHMRSPRLERRD